MWKNITHKISTFVLLALIFLSGANTFVIAASEDYYALPNNTTASKTSPCEALKYDCAKCADVDAMWTAVGCIPTDIVGLSTSLAAFLLGLAGLFLAVIALLFIILSTAALRFVGVKIFILPGFFDN